MHCKIPYGETSIVGMGPRVLNAGQIWKFVGYFCRDIMGKLPSVHPGTSFEVAESNDFRLCQVVIHPTILGLVVNRWDSPRTSWGHSS